MVFGEDWRLPRIPKHNFIGKDKIMSKSIYTHKHHIVPKHAGGSDDPSNLKKLTIEEHALAHKKLFFIYGNPMDEIAYLGLEGMIDKAECIRRSLSENAKRVNKKWPAGTRGHWNYSKAKGNGKNFKTDKTYEITFPDGKKETIKGLSKFCRDNELNLKAFHKGCIQRERKHKGYSAARIVV